MNKELLDLIDSVIANDDEAAKAAFSTYLANKTGDILKEQQGDFFQKPTHTAPPSDIFSASTDTPVIPPSQTSGRYLVRPMGVSYDDLKEAVSVAFNNQKKQATILDTKTNLLVDWKAAFKLLQRGGFDADR